MTLKVEGLQTSIRPKDSVVIVNYSNTAQDTEVYPNFVSAEPELENSTNTTAAQRDESLARLEILVQIIILVLALVGNSCVLTALARRGKAGSRMHMFIFHLSIADLLVAVFNILPQLIWDITETFVGGDALCRFVKFMQVFVMYLSTYMLVMTAVDRYLSVCHPLSSFNTSSKTKVYIMIASAYTLSAVLSLPQPIIFRYQERVEFQVYDCWASFEPAWTLNLYVTSFTVAVYLIPLVILVYTYVSICYAIWQKHKHSKSQYQLDVPENTSRLICHNGIIGEAGNHRGIGTGTGVLPGQRNSNSSRTHSTSSPLYPRGGPDFGVDVSPRDFVMRGGIANHMISSTHTHRNHTHSQQGGFYKLPNRYIVGSGTRGAIRDPRTGINASGHQSGTCLRDGSDMKEGRTDRDDSRKRKKSSSNNRPTVGRSNAIRRRANLVVTAANGSARSSSGSVRGLSRAKMKTVKLTFVVIMAYIVCWSPFFVSQLWWLYDETQENNDAVVIMILLGSLNSCCNPLIYLSFSGKILRRVGLRRRRPRSSSGGCCCCSLSWWKSYCSNNINCSLGCCIRSCDRCTRSKANPQHPQRTSKGVNNNSSGREDHNKDGGEGEQFKAGFKAAPRDVVCTGGIGVVPSIELRDIM